jgi:hypothetical protein
VALVSPSAQIQLAVAANQPISNVTPPRPVTDATCISGVWPYWVYATAPHDPIGLNLVASCSTTTQVNGNTSVDATPGSRGSRTPSRAYAGSRTAL